MILRFFESKGESCRATVGLPAAIHGVQSVNLLEKEETPVEFSDGRCELDVGKFEIVTPELSF